jgi:hypothetical protein
MVHQGIKCNKCSVTPINGIRFQCSVQNNLNYCEACEAKVADSLQYPLVKVRDPKKAIRHAEVSEVVSHIPQRSSVASV